MSRTETSAPAGEQMTQLLSQAERKIARRIERALGSDVIGLDQWRVLALLADGSGHAMNEIAAYAMVPPPTLTKVIDRLIERNVVYRRVDETDRRRVLVFLAARGRDLHRRLVARVEQEEAAIAAALGPADAERLTELLGRVLDLAD
jgi:DNA-binding MarR family transcriptional regulator